MKNIILGLCLFGFGLGFADECTVKVRSSESKYVGTWRVTIFVGYDFIDRDNNTVNYLCVNDYKQVVLTDELSNITTDYKCYPLVIETKSMKSLDETAQVICH